MCCVVPTRTTSSIRLKAVFVTTTRRTFIASLSALAAPLHGHAQNTLRVGGSGMCKPLLGSLSALYAGQPGASPITVAPPLGSTGSIRGVLSGQLELACISRPLTAIEKSGGLVTVPLARSPFVVIAHPHVPLREMQGPELIRLLSDPGATFSDGTRARPILRPAEDTDTHMLARLYPGVAAALTSCATRPGIVVAATDQDAVRAVASTPGAFSVSTLGLLVPEQSQVKILDWSGHSPLRDDRANPDYPHQKEVRFVFAAHAAALTLKFVAFARTTAAQSLMARWGYLPVKPGGTP